MLPGPPKLLILVLLATFGFVAADARAMSLYSYGLDSLVFSAAQIVEGRPVGSLRSKSGW